MTAPAASDTAVWWVRRDLRLADNPALAAAGRDGRRVVPVFILDPVLLDSPMTGPKRLAFLYAALRDLDGALRARGSRLIVRRGAPAAELAGLVAETGASAIYAEEDHSTYARRRDADVADRVPLCFTGSPAIRPPGTVLKRDGTPFTVFTPFSRAWHEQAPLDRAELIPAPERLPDPGELHSEPLPDEPAHPADSPFPATEAEARRRLLAFAAGPIDAYGDTRHRPDLDGTSRLSAYLRFGLVSGREAAVVVQEAGGAGAATWLNELIWRDFYIHILHHFPHVAQTSFRETLRDIAWRNDPAEFEAWCAGRTGYPIVDAAMRQLAATGWMHNRSRMIVASFLVKDLLIDWRWGEQWFMRHLIDGDPAANNGGWQWTAGTGTDAAPYFRVFNPVTQGKKFDPEGDYVRRWVPELAGVPAATIHEPWRLSTAEQRAGNCVIGRDYPSPLVDHAFARERALAAFGAAR